MEIDHDKCRKLGEIMGSLLSSMNPDPFTDPRYYPSPSDSGEDVARYFLVMVAMDHRLSRPGRPYEAVLEDGYYHGADLLYRLGRKKYDEDRGFFDPRRLAEVRVEEVARWLTPPRRPDLTPVDVEQRALLLRDLGLKTVKLYRGSVSSIMKNSGGMLRGNGRGLIERMKVFVAYSDPVEKKPYLLAKFLERRGLFKPRDPWNKEVPVDNHLTRIALRLGLVTPPAWMKTMLKLKKAFGWEDDAMLRLAVRKAYRVAASHAGLDPFMMDDYLWVFGRKCCVYDSRSTACSSSRCSEECMRIGGCMNNECVFREICTSATLSEKPTEHLFLDTWYY